MRFKLVWLSAAKLPTAIVTAAITPITWGQGTSLTTWARSCPPEDRKSTRLNSSHLVISYAVFCLKKKTDNCVMSGPSMEMVPDVGVSMPPMSPSKVDFPLPDGPMMARNCLAGTSSEMSSRMETSRPPLTSRMERLRIAIMPPIIQKHGSSTENRLPRRAAWHWTVVLRSAARQARAQNPGHERGRAARHQVAPSVQCRASPRRTGPRGLRRQLDGRARRFAGGSLPGSTPGETPAHRLSLSRSQRRRQRRDNGRRTTPGELDLEKQTRHRDPGARRQ